MPRKLKLGEQVYSVFSITIPTKLVIQIQPWISYKIKLDHNSNTFSKTVNLNLLLLPTKCQKTFERGYQLTGKRTKYIQKALDYYLKRLQKQFIIPVKLTSSFSEFIRMSIITWKLRKINIIKRVIKNNKDQNDPVNIYLKENGFKLKGEA